MPAEDKYISVTQDALDAQHRMLEMDFNPAGAALERHLFGGLRSVGAVTLSDGEKTILFHFDDSIDLQDRRVFKMVSNIMKTKHETVKNSISNIR